MIYNKCLQPGDYDTFDEHREVEDFIRGNARFRYEHEHRKWEYGLALKFIKEVKPKSILNVGGGNSPLSTLAYKYCPYVTEIDPTPATNKDKNIVYIDDAFPTEGLKGKFDLVLCTSVIEHVEEDHYFFRALLAKASRYLFMTTDFHPSGRAMGVAHYRTYNTTEMFKLLNIANSEFDFFSFGLFTEYHYEFSMVYNYTFAALALKKEEDYV